MTGGPVPEDAGTPGADASGEGAAVGEEAPRRRSRRVTTAAVPGTDPHPDAEEARHADGENDERLRADKPPHWG